MSEIKNLEGVTTDELKSELSLGARFIMYKYCYSIIAMTFRKNSIYFVRAGQSTRNYSIGFGIVNFLAGWWGIPWGPIYTIGGLYNNLKGGQDVTEEVLEMIVKGKTNAEINEDN